MADHLHDDIPLGLTFDDVLLIPLESAVLPSGADRLAVGSDGVARLDVRATFETDDGARIYLQYHGVSVSNEAATAKRTAGGSTEYGEAYFMTAPRFETGDPRYAWLNAIVSVGEGRTGPGWVEYRIYQVVNG